MKIKHVMGAVLTLDSGESIYLERLGKGTFHTCYVDRTKGQVYSFTIERNGAEDYSKEILSHPTCGVDPNPHIPPVERLEDTDGRRVYRMPLYQPIRAAKHPTAWAQLRQLMQAREEAWRTVLQEQVTPRKMRLTDIGYMVNDRVCTIIDRPSFNADLIAALWSLRDAATNYGSAYCFEFSRRNCLVDGSGNLILLDVLFNLEATEALSKARLSQTGQRGR